MQSDSLKIIQCKEQAMIRYILGIKKKDKASPDYFLEYIDIYGLGVVLRTDMLLSLTSGTQHRMSRKSFRWFHRMKQGGQNN